MFETAELSWMVLRPPASRLLADFFLQTPWVYRSSPDDLRCTPELLDHLIISENFQNFTSPTRTSRTSAQRTSRLYAASECTALWLAISSWFAARWAATTRGFWWAAVRGDFSPYLRLRLSWQSPSFKGIPVIFTSLKSEYGASAPSSDW